MNEIVSKLFATPVLHRNFSDEAVMLSNLAAEGVDHFQKVSSGGVDALSFFETNGPGVSVLKEKIDFAARELLLEQGVLHRASGLSMRARHHTIQPLGSEAPHNHPDCDMTAILYVQCPPRCGDLLLIDPRGYMDIMWADPDTPRGGGSKFDTTFIRVQPYNGLFLLLPSYLMHCVETNLSGHHRVSLIVEIDVEFKP